VPTRYRAKYLPGTPERCEGKGGRFSWKGTFQLIYSILLRNVCKTSGVELRLIMFSIYWMIGVWGGSPPGDCTILEARWLHFLRFLKQIRKRIALTISDNSLFRQGNPLNWKGTFAPLAPPGKGQRGAAAPPAHQFRRPWYLRFIIVFIRFAKYRIVLKICQQDNFPFWIKIRDFTKKRHCYSHLLQVHSISFKFPNFLQCCSSQWLYWVLLQILIKCRESCMNDW
jgi:hypothetical protein